MLLTSGYAFPEAANLEAALMADTDIVLSTWLLSSARSYRHPGNEPIRRLPNSILELAGGSLHGQNYPGYDCVVLFDPDPTLWPDGFSGLLTRFVAEKNGGLIYIAGQRNTAAMFAQADQPHGQYMGLLPVQRDEHLFRTAVQQQLIREEGYRPVPTEEGLDSSIFVFSEDREENREIVAALPTLLWHHSISNVSPGAAVLARHSHPAIAIHLDGRREEEPLVVTQRAGLGRVVWVGFDSTYRWRGTVPEQYADYWSRAIAYASQHRNELLRELLQLRTDRPAYRVGDMVTITAQFTDPAMAEQCPDVLFAKVHTAQGEVQLTFRPVAEELTYQVRFRVEEPGDYLISAWPNERTPDGRTDPRVLLLSVDE